MVAILGALLVMPILAAFLATPSVSADELPSDSKNITFRAEIAEALTVTLQTPATWASGNVSTYDSTNDRYVSDLLRNKVNVTIATNTEAGYSVSMYTQTNTNLLNQTDNTSTISTLDKSYTASAFPANAWGYSIDDNASGSSSANYNAMSTSAIPLFSSTTGATSQDVFFGAKADSSKPSGTYSKAVIFSAVTGVVTPTVPTNPVTPEVIADSNNSTATYNSAPAGDSTAGATTYTTRTQSGSGTSSVSGAVNTTTTQVTKGDTTSSYQAAAGVNTSSDGEGTPLAATLAAAAVASAVAGVGFYALAKRNKDDDEEA